MAWARSENDVVASSSMRERVHNHHIGDTWLTSRTFGVILFVVPLLCGIAASVPWQDRPYRGWAFMGAFIALAVVNFWVWVIWSWLRRR
jgi:hypothetical protein